MKTFVSIFLFLTCFVLGSAMAAEVTVCKMGNVERRVEVGSTDPAKTVPCEVKYFKENLTEGKVLWSAQNEAGYCVTKAKEFVDKLGTMGWNCVASATTEQPKTEAPAKTEPSKAEPAKKTAK